MGMKEGWKGQGQPDRAAYGTERIYPDPIMDNEPMKVGKESQRGYTDVDMPPYKPYSKAKDLDGHEGRPAHEVKGGQHKPNHIKAGGSIDIAKNKEIQAK